MLTVQDDALSVEIDDVDYLVSAGFGLWLPHLFSAQMERGNWKIEARFEATTDGTLALCEIIAIPGDRVAPIKLDPAPLLRRATALATHTGPEAPAGTPDYEVGGSFIASWGEAERKVKHRARTIDSDHLQEVAELYRSNPDRPTSAVADHFRVARSTAAKWVGRARAAGHLGKTYPRTKGESAERST